MSTSEFPSTSASLTAFPRLADGPGGPVFRGRAGAVEQFAAIIRGSVGSSSDYTDERYNVDRAVPIKGSGGGQPLKVKADKLPGVGEIITATNLAELADRTHLLADGTVVQVSAWVARGSPDAKVYFFDQTPPSAVVVQVKTGTGGGIYDGIVLDGVASNPLPANLAMPMGMDLPTAVNAKVLNLEEDGQTGNRLAANSYAVGVIRGMTTDTPPRSIVVVGGGVGATAGATEVGSAGNTSETADDTTWSRATDATPANVYLVSRVVYNAAGDQAVYAFIRELSFDARGVLLAVSGETRVTVDATESCP